MTGCWICLGELPEDTETYHPRCLKTLFGATRAPAIEVSIAKLHTLALAMVGHTSISGIQRKISVSLSHDRATLQVAVEGGRYILKPQAQTYPHLPENEHLTMRLAALVGLEIPPCGLVRLKDDSIAYIVARFDRPAAGGKVRLEDFCQLAEKSPKEKYDGSAELCARLVKRYASEQLIEVSKLYRLLAFVWWTGNGDMHLKNFSLVASPEGLQRLSPAYDLLCTRLVIEGDQLALPVQGKKDKLTRASWLKLAEYCELKPRPAEGVLDSLASSLDEALGFVERSALPGELKKKYARLLRTRTASLEKG